MERRGLCLGFKRMFILGSLMIHIVAFYPHVTLGTEAKPVPELFKEALQAFQSGNYKEASLKLKAFLKKYSYNPLVKRAIFLLGDCYYYLDEYEKAIKTYQQALQSYPLYSEAPKATLFLGRAYKKLGSLTEADRVFQKGIKGYPGNKYINEFYYERGLIAYEFRELEKAIGLLGKALENCKDAHLYIKICFALGDAYTALSNYIAARNFYQEAFKKRVSPYVYLRSHPITYFNVAEMFLNNREYIKAVRAYLEIASLYPQAAFAPKALIKAGDTCLKMEEYQKALKIYGKVIRLYPETNEALISKFRMADLGIEKPGLKVPLVSYYEAYRHPWDTYQELAKSSLPELAELAHFRMAELLFKQNKFGETIKVLKEYLTLFPSGKLREHCLNLLEETVLLWIDQLYKSQQYLAILKIFLQNADYLKHKGEVLLSKIANAYYQVGLYEEALNTYQSLPLDPENVLKIAQLYYLVGSYPDAEHLLEGYLQTSSDAGQRCEISQLLAETCYKEKKFSKALVYYLGFLDQCHPAASCLLYVKIADCYAHTKAWDNAISFLKKVMFEKNSTGHVDKNLAKRTHILLGDCYYHKQNFEEALENFNQALFYVVDQDEINFVLYRIGDCYKHLDLIAKAASTYQKIKKQDTFWQALVRFSLDNLSWGKKNKRYISLFMPASLNGGER
ncbi:MAG: tetratricopeptide repeat protein [Candidatus Desulfofervidaceae bacterium]|nr:tetratricopeptide repeat protein [Candidatus Desulfofervidaceae bacterium]